MKNRRVKKNYEGLIWTLATPFFVLLFVLKTVVGITQPQVELQLVASGFSSPTSIAHAGDGRLFITERSGKIKIIDGGGNVLLQPFIDLNSVVINSGGQSEQGLLGLAFHPDYQNNGFFYVNYIDNNGNTRISRFSVSTADPHVADPGSEKNILTIQQPFANHNGGCLQFGPDNFLYIGMGDGGAFDDPQNNSQNRLSLLGKMLRIDVDGGDPYSIPPSNPFADDDFTLDEIWALGLRNPWRFSFDRLTHDLWIGDVGQGQWEEVNFQPSAGAGGENYGWRCYEGNAPYLGGCNPGDSLVFPVSVYAHPTGFGCASITGGYVYRGSNYPDLYGWYLYADYCSQEMYGIRKDGLGWEEALLGTFPGPYSFVSFGENAEGEMFVTTFQGAVYKIQTEACAGLLADAITTPDCDNQGTGAVDITVIGGTPPYSVNPPLFTNLQGGNYLYTIEDANNCQFPLQVSIQNLLTPNPAPIIMFDPVSQILEVPDTFGYYQWYQDGLPVSGAQSYFYVWDNTEGSFTVEVGNGAACTTFSPPIELVINETKESQQPEIFTIFPNPATQKIFLKGSESILSAGFESVVLVDAYGNLVPLDGSSKEDYSLLIEHLVPGVYTLSIQTGERRMLARFVKIR